MGVFDELLAKVSAEDRQVIDRYPDLKQSVEDMEARLASESEYAKQWESWADKYWDKDANATKVELGLRDQLQQTRERVAELELQGGSEMTFDEIQKALKEHGYAPASELEGKFISAKAHEDALNNLAIGFQQVYTKTAGLPLRHQREFNEDLDMGKVFEYMQTNRVLDPSEAYERMVGDRRREAAEKRHQEEIQKAKDEGRREAEQKVAMSQGSLPVDQAGSGPALGHLQRAVMEKVKGQTADKPLPEVDLGRGKLAEIGYENLLKERAARVN